MSLSASDITASLALPKSKYQPFMQPSYHEICKVSKHHGMGRFLRMVIRNESQNHPKKKNPFQSHGRAILT